MGENKVREGRCNLWPSVKASLFWTFAIECANRVVSMHLGKDWILCPELLRRVKRTRNMYKHLGNPPPSQDNHLLCSLWDSHLSLWEKKSRILAAFTCLNKNFNLGASPWHLCLLTETVVWSERKGKSAGGFSLQLFYCRQNRIQVHAAPVLSSYYLIYNSSFQQFIIMELSKRCMQVSKDTVNI